MYWPVVGFSSQSASQTLCQVLGFCFAKRNAVFQSFSVSSNERVDLKQLQRCSGEQAEC